LGVSSAHKETYEELQVLSCKSASRRITDRTLENQSYRTSGLNLVIAAIAYWNMLYMGRAVEHLRSSGRIVPDELLTHVAPPCWRHISLIGDYLWQHAATGAGQQSRSVLSTAETLPE
jgi:hypothetical protein